MLIGHLDSDCFYVSCERIRHAHLLHLPVGVLGNQGACVIAKSYEMRACGVKTGMPIWDSLKLCPHGVYVKRDFKWYEVISRRMLEVLRKVSPMVEYYSIDEMFFDASTLPKAFGQSLEEATGSLQQLLLREAGVPVSIGISRTKSLAKLASDMNKPFGYALLLDPGGIEDFLRATAIEEASGVGERSRLKLAAHSIRTCLDFVQADRRLIRRLLTKRGEDLWWELNGHAVQPILTSRPPHKCLSRGGSLGETTDDLDRLTAWLVRNTERLIEELDYHQVYTARLVLWLECKGSSGWMRAVNLPAATAQFSLLTEAGKQLLGEALRCIRSVCGMHLLAEQLTYRRCAQRDLFFQADPVAERVAAVKRQINNQVGRFALRSGETLPLSDIYADAAQSYDICDVHGKQCF